MRNAPAKLLLPRAAVATRTNLLNKKVALPSPRGETGDVGQSAQREYCVMISSSAAHRGVTVDGVRSILEMITQNEFCGEERKL